MPSRRQARKDLRARYLSSCSHPVSSDFKTLFSSCRPILPSDTACPQCIMSRVIHALSSARARFVADGGCIFSKDQKSSTMTINYWSTASALGFRLYGLLEAFVKTEAKEEDKDVAYAAMNCWVTYRSKTRVPPGMEDRYPDGVDQEDEVLDIPMLDEHSLAAHVLIQQAEQAGRDRWHIPAQRLRGPWLVPVEAYAVQHEVLQPTQSDITPSKVEDILPAEIDGALKPRKSSLKRSRDAESHTITPKKRVRIEDHATVSSTYASLVPYPFKAVHCPEDIARRLKLPVISHETTKDKHSPNAFAETRRDKMKMKRPSCRHVPGRWTSPPGFEKQETSWVSREGGCRFDLLMLAEERDWRVQWEEGEKLEGVIKALSARWCVSHASRCRGEAGGSREFGMESC